MSGMSEEPGFAKVPLVDDDASWELADLHVKAQLERPIELSRAQAHERKFARSEQQRQHRSELQSLFLFRIALPDLWTAAQVAATAVTLGPYIASKARKWRDKRLELPQGTRLTLTLTPAKRDDRRQAAKIVIADIHTKTAEAITSDIKQTLMSYARQDLHAERRAIPSPLKRRALRAAREDRPPQESGS